MQSIRRLPAASRGCRSNLFLLNNNVPSLSTTTSSRNIRKNIRNSSSMQVRHMSSASLLSNRSIYINTSNTNRNLYLCQAHRAFFFKSDDSSVFNKKISKEVKVHKKMNIDSKEIAPDSIKGRILGFFMKKLMGFVARTVQKQIQDMEKTFDHVVAHAESALNLDPRVRDALGSDIEIVDMKMPNMDDPTQQAQMNLHKDNDKFELKLDNIIIQGSKGVTCRASLFAEEVDEGSGELVLRTLSAQLPGGRRVDVKIPSFSNKVIDIKV